MSWARYWATRASDPLQASAATPLAARSWLTRLNWTPAAPPTLATGGAGLATGFGRGGTGGLPLGALPPAGAPGGGGCTLPPPTGSPGGPTAPPAGASGRAAVPPL